MDERALQFRVGVVAITAILITSILVMLFGNMPSLWPDEYTIFLKFSEAPGVRKGTPIRKSGVRIGRVTGVELKPEGVLVTAKMDPDYPIDRNEVCYIRSASLWGDAELEFSLADQQRSNVVLTDGEFINETVVAGDPMKDWVVLKNDLTSAARSVAQAGDQVTLLAGDARKTADGVDDLSREIATVIRDNKDEVRNVIHKLDKALTHFNNVAEPIDNLVQKARESGEMEEALTEIPGMIKDMRSTTASVLAISQALEENLDDIGSLTGEIGRRGPGMVANMDSGIRNLDGLLGELLRFSKKINDPDGAIGALAHDRELYDQLRRTVANAEEITWQLRPIMKDVRVFTDKIARDPGRLGVKGALERRRTGTKHMPLEGIPSLPGGDGYVPHTGQMNSPSDFPPR